MKAIVLLSALAACTPVPRSSLGHLGYVASMAEVKLPVRETARTLTQLFAHRGYALIDQHATRDGLALRFKGLREAAPIGEGPAYQFGSEFAVAVSAAQDHAVIAFEGGPTIDGAPVCQLGARLPCLGTTGSPHSDGLAEAELVRGVIAELALDELAAPLDPAHPAVIAARAADLERCHVRYRNALADVNEIADPARRLEAVHLLEPCPEP